MTHNILLEISKDDQKRAQYESELLFDLDQRSRLNHARKEGKLEVARKMLKRGTPVEYIAEIQKLKES